MTCTDNTKEKDPGAKLYYKFDWKAQDNGNGPSDWLADGETIDTFTITEDSGITVLSSAKADSDTTVVVRLSGGEAPNVYKVVCHIVTTPLGNEDDRTMYIKMIDK